MIEARELVKSYGGSRVLNGASLCVNAGQCVVLTGDNGSGKTSLLHVLVGLRRADGGQVLWRGRDLTGAGRRQWRAARREWGFLPQQTTLPRRASVRQMLAFHTRMRGVSIQTARQWLSEVGLADTEHQRVGELSGGMRQRLGIALTLFHEPNLIVMDEPAASLDPAWRGALTDWLQSAAGRGAAVLVTSQLHETWNGKVRHCRCEAGRVMEPANESASTSRSQSDHRMETINHKAVEA
jgi:ABC-type multidrug transport system ATPase subunit